MPDTEPLTIENGLSVMESWSFLIDGVARPDQRPDETDAEWTQRCIHVGAEAGKNRQCSIGWHEECSDPDGEQCQCPCHRTSLTRVVGALSWFRDLLREVSRG